MLPDHLNELGGPPPAPRLDRRLLFRAGVGIGLLAVLGAVATWVSLDMAGHTAPVYGNGGLASARTWTWDGSDFTAQPVTALGPNSNEADMAYDKRNGVLVLWDHGCSRLVMGFTGGCQSQVNQTWTWSGRLWTARKSASAPRATGQGAMLYDNQLGQVVYLNRLGEAWAWTGSAWNALASAGAPRLAQPGSQANPRLALVAAGYDESRNLLVLALPDTTWTWDGHAWSQLNGGIGGGDGQANPQAAYDAALGELVYSGAKSLWTWDGTSWQAHAQPNLGGGTLGYDPIRKNVVAVRQDTAACDSAACPTDVWTWDGATWTALRVVHKAALPLTRSGLSNPPMAFDDAHSLTVVFVSAS